MRIPIAPCTKFSKVCKYQHKMIIFDNIIFSLQKAGGISVVWQKLLQNILNNSYVDFKCIEYPKSDDNIFRKDIIIPEDKITLHSGPAIIKRYFSPALDITEPSVFHSSAYRVHEHPLIKNVTTVHDFTYEVAVTGLKLKVHKWRKYRAIYGSDVIICISKNTANDLIKYCPNVDKNKIRIVYNGVSESYKPEDNRDDDLKDCILFVGARDSYKNFLFTAEAIATTNYKLLICGAPLNEREQSLLELALGRNRYKYLGRVSDEELNHLYNSVHCLAYPSSYEGFGIPVLEAQRAKCPVIALNASSIPEVMGPKDFLMQELSIKEFQKRLIELESPNVRQLLVEEGFDFSQKFSWNKMAAEYVEIYNELLRKQ